MNSGIFITLEGTEGSGKSLQIERICDRLAQEGIDYLRTLEPGGTEFGREIRRVLLTSGGSLREPVAELLLYLSDRYQHLRQKIEPALDQGRVVVSDRYHDATLAYQAYARGIGFELVDGLAELLNIRKPDLTLIFDVDIETGLNRARLRNQAEQSNMGRFEDEDLSFHRRVQEGYRLLAQREPERIRLIDASGSPGEVFQRAWHPISELL